MRNDPMLATYYRTVETTATLGGQTLRLIWKPGLPRWDRISAAAALLADVVETSSDCRTLLMGCGHGALASFLARQAPGGNVCLTGVNWVALQMSELTLAANDVTNARTERGISVLPEEAGAFDAAVVVMPKGRSLVRRWLAEAHAALKPGGRVYLAGATKEGIKSAIKDAGALFQAVEVLGYRKHNRVACGTKMPERPAEAGWLREPGISPGTWHEFEVDVRGARFRLCGLPGVFSYKKLDQGTSMLLSQLDVTRGSRVLDVGCGYGIIGLVAARMGAAHVDMVDANTLAVASARRNIEFNEVGNARAFTSDALSAVSEEEYDLVLTNPPFHAGKAVDYEVARAFIEHSRRVLRPGGRLMLVTNTFIRYDRLLKKQFERLECLAETGRYRVLAGTR